MNIPTVETERLLLRAWRDADLDAYAVMVGDPETMRFIGGPLARPDAWRSMAYQLGHWVLRGHGMWAVERKSDGALIGRIGVQRPETWPAIEIAWTLGQPFRNQGYATEAAKASMDWGFQKLPVARLVSLIDPANVPSQNVAKRLGQTKGGPATLFAQGSAFNVDVWEITRDLWTSS